MDTLQKLFDSKLDKQIKTAYVDILRKKFGDLGIALKEVQLKEILQKLESAETNLKIDLVDGQILGSQIAMPDYLEHKIQIEITDSELEELIDKFPSSLPDVIPGMVEKSADVLLEESRRKLISDVKAADKGRLWFEKRRVKLWKKPFQLLEFFLLVITEMGADFNDHYRQMATERATWSLRS